VVTISDFAEDGALFALPVPASPTFAAHFGLRAGTVATDGKSLAEMIEGLSESDAHQLIVSMLAQEAAAIMRLAVSDVDLDASIDSLGMDSLMALELRMSIEQIQAGIADDGDQRRGQLEELAMRILSMLRGEDAASASPLSEVESALIAIHGGGELAAEVPTQQAAQHG
jgi:hypothetical protein